MIAKFVEERGDNNAVNLWSPMTKRKLHSVTWMPDNKRVKVKDGNKVAELTEDRTLFTQML